MDATLPPTLSITEIQTAARLIEEVLDFIDPDGPKLRLRTHGPARDADGRPIQDITHEWAYTKCKPEIEKHLKELARIVPMAIRQTTDIERNSLKPGWINSDDEWTAIHLWGISSPSNTSSIAYLAIGTAAPRQHRVMWEACHCDPSLFSRQGEKAFEKWAKLPETRQADSLDLSKMRTIGDVITRHLMAWKKHLISSMSRPLLMHEQHLLWAFQKASLKDNKRPVSLSAALGVCKNQPQFKTLFGQEKPPSGTDAKKILKNLTALGLIAKTGGKKGKHYLTLHGLTAHEELVSGLLSEKTT